MPNDKILIERIRTILSQRKGLFSEKRMFGTVCFMLNGNICVGAWRGSLLVRVGKKQYDETLAEPYTKPADIGEGWVLVEQEGIEFEEDLIPWINKAIKFTSSLPAKCSSSEPLIK